MLGKLQRYLQHKLFLAKGSKLKAKIQGRNFFFGNYKGFTAGSYIWLENGVKININGNAHLILKDYVYINCYSIIDCHNSIVIGNRVQIGPHCYITDFDHSLKVDIRQASHRLNKTYAPVILEDNVWLGANVVILKGVTIGKNSVIAAGSVVTKSIPDNVLAMGTPAKVVKQIEGNYDDLSYWENK